MIRRLCSPTWQSQAGLGRPIIAHGIGAPMKVRTAMQAPQRRVPVLAAGGHGGVRLHHSESVFEHVQELAAAADNLTRSRKKVQEKRRTGLRGTAGCTPLCGFCVCAVSEFQRGAQEVRRRGKTLPALRDHPIPCLLRYLQQRMRRRRAGTCPARRLAKGAGLLRSGRVGRRPA